MLISNNFQNVGKMNRAGAHECGMLNLKGNHLGGRLRRGDAIDIKPEVGEMD